MFSSAAIVPRECSLPQWPCWIGIPHHPKRQLIQPCREISAGAVPIRLLERQLTVPSKTGKIMKKPVLKDKGMFPEQYELLERTSSPVLSRRRFFKYMGTGLASFLLVSDVLSSRALANLGADERSIAEDTIAAWIQIG